MAQKTYNVLFVCTANSARSVLAEGLMNHLSGGRFRAYSAGSHPRGEVHPLALKTLADWKIPTQGFRSKSWEEFAAAGAPPLDFVFTVCDNAAGEVCPIWPGQPMTAHWGVSDPAAVQGTEAEQAKAFYVAAQLLKRRIELMLALPLETLDSIRLKSEVSSIGSAP